MSRLYAATDSDVTACGWRSRTLSAAKNYIPTAARNETKALTHDCGLHGVRALRSFGVPKRLNSERMNLAARVFHPFGLA